LSGQLLVGLINGSFYAILSLGLSIIFGLLGIVNLTQGAFYMVGAFFAWMLLQWLGVGYWGALILAPLGVAAIGMILELLLIRLRAAAHIRPSADHPGLFRLHLRHRGTALPDPGRTARRLQPRLHVLAEVPRVGGRGRARPVLCDLVFD
jgi:hypothetical protein